MDTHAILSMEASLLQSRIKNWFTHNVGRDIILFRGLNDNHGLSRQEEVIQITLRFTNSLLVALELIGEQVSCSATIKFLLANTLRMIELHAKSHSDKDNNEPFSFIANIRRRFTASLNLFRFLISPEYKSAPKEMLEKPALLQLGGDPLYVWGESLLSFAECSLKFWKPQYISTLRAAEHRFVKSLHASPNSHQAHFALGNTVLLLAKNETPATSPYLSLIHRAKDAFFEASQNLPGVQDYHFYFIRMCSLLGQEQEVQQMLESFVYSCPANCAPLLEVQDFDRYKSQKWFRDIQVLAASLRQQGNALPPSPQTQQKSPHPTQTPKAQAPKSPPRPAVPPMQHPLYNIADYQLLSSYPPPPTTYADIPPYFVYPDPYAYQPMSTIPPPYQLQPGRGTQIAHAQGHGAQGRAQGNLQGKGSGGIGGVEDKQYGQLQTSLIESGFSIKRLLEVFNWLPVSSGILQAQPEEDNDYVKKQKLRLQERLELYQLKPKREIPGDGNCQMHAISDQLYNTIDRSKEVRKTIVEWLRKNKDWKLPNESILHEFVHDRPWEEYCTMMEKDGCWGDHLTLLAASEIHGVVISIMSSVEGDNFITEIHPTAKKPGNTKVLLLSHYAEFHYGSLTHIGETLK